MEAETIAAMNEPPNRVGGRVNLPATTPSAFAKATAGQAWHAGPHPAVPVRLTASGLNGSFRERAQTVNRPPQPRRSEGQEVGLSRLEAGRWFDLLTVMPRAMRVEYPAAICHPPTPNLRRDERDESG